MKTFSPEAEAAIASGDVQIATLVSIFFSTGTLHITDYAIDVTLSSIVYQATGGLIEVPQFGENGDEPLAVGSIVLSNVGTGLSTIVRSGANQLFKPVSVKQVLLSTDGTVLSVLQSRNIYITGIKQNESETSDTVTLSLSSHLIDFEGTKGRTTSNSSQVKYAESLGDVDTSFKHTLVLKSNVKWGR